MAKSVDTVTTNVDFNSVINHVATDKSDNKNTFIPYQIGGVGHSGIASSRKIADKKFSNYIRDEYLTREPVLRTANMMKNKNDPNRYYPPEDINDPSSRRITPDYLRAIQNDTNLTPAQKAEKMSKIRNAFSDWAKFTSSVRRFMNLTHWDSLFKLAPITTFDIRKILNTAEASEAGIDEQHLKNWRHWLYSS